MPFLQCIDPNCKGLLSVNKVSFHLDGGVLVGRDLVCPKCSKGVIPVPEELSISEISVSQGRFASMTEAEKKDTLKKRARKHFVKNDQAAVEQKRHDTIQQVKEQFKKR